VLLFDGPHMMAGYTRTLLDKEARRTRARLLFGSFAAFLVGPAFLAASVVTKSEAPFVAFLGLGAIWGYWHVIRQHYGFVALYRARSGEAVTRASFALDKGALYAGMWLPWLHFAIAHPIGRALRGVDGPPGHVASAVANALVVAWIGVVLGYVAYAVVGARPRGLKAPYLLLVVVFHGLVYFVAARFEPVYALAKGPDQQLLLMTVMGGIFHSAQYVGIVWLHNARTYRGERAVSHGLAARASATLGRYLVVCVAFSAIYLVVAATTAIYPAIALAEGATLGPVRVSQIALCVWWGIALQHYVVDQYIWRIKKDAALRARLGAAAGGTGEPSPAPRDRLGPRPSSP
jgi:hypothetical protein